MKELFRHTVSYRAIAAGAAHGEYAPATLVVFPDGKHLRELLRLLAQAFFGADARAAELAGRESLPDCIFLPAEGEKLTAEGCGRIVEESLLSPVEGERKLFVLDAFHTASPLVQNKLLKILEDPPAGVHFLLGAETEFAVLPTVLSRVVKYIEPPFSEELVKEALERMHGGVAAEAAAASGGILSVAESLLEDGGEELGLAERFLFAEEGELVSFCRETGERKQRREFFSALKALLRDALFWSVGESKHCKLGKPCTPAIAERYQTGALLEAIRLTGEAEKQIYFNASPASCLFELALALEKERKRWQKLS